MLLMLWRHALLAASCQLYVEVCVLWVLTGIAHMLDALNA